MTTPRHPLRQSALVAALLAAFAAHAETGSEKVERLTTPESSVSVGAGLYGGETEHYGIYNGIGESRAAYWLDFQLNELDKESGLWKQISGRNLGRDNGEFRVDVHKQGDWRASFDYNKTERRSPYGVNTGLQGAGTANLNVVPTATAAQDFRPATTREALSFGIDKVLGGNYDVQVRYKTEDKDGTRLFGRGTTTPNYQFLAEPIHSTTRQLDASLAYTGKKLQLVGGYYASAYSNRNAYLTVTESTASSLATFNPLSLAPTNRAQQLYLTGGYNFAPSTRSTFKIAHSRAEQDDAFSPGLTTLRNDLGGRIDTTLLMTSLSARPLAKLAVSALLRYEDRADKSAVARYFTNPAGANANSSATSVGDNEPRSLTNKLAKLDATYELAADFRLQGGVDYENKVRDSSPVHVVSHRNETSELTTRLELRKPVAETLSGAISLARSDRDGSDYLPNMLFCTGPGVYGTIATNCGTSLASNKVSPIHYADRKRDKIGLQLDWTPLEALALQFVASASDDEYGLRTYGVKEGSARSYAVDLTYQLSPDWQATGWLSHSENRISQMTFGSSSAWSADLSSENTASGIGVRGKLGAKVKVGANFESAYDRDRYDMARDSGTATVAALPAVFFRKNTLSAFADYAFSLNAGVRLDATYEQWKTDDWTWESWAYTDGSKVIADKEQNARFVGVSAYYKWW